MEGFPLARSEKLLCPFAVSADKGVELGALIGGEPRELAEGAALQLSLLVGLTSGAVAFQGRTAKDFVRAGMLFGFGDEVVLREGCGIIVDKGHLCTVEPSSLGSHHAFDAANIELSRPEAVLRERDHLGAHSFGPDESENL